MNNTITHGGDFSARDRKWRLNGEWKNDSMFVYDLPHRGSNRGKPKNSKKHLQVRGVALKYLHI